MVLPALSIVLKGTRLLGCAFSPIHLLLLCPVLLAVLVTVVNRKRAVYLVDYACFLPSPTWRCPNSTFIEHFRLGLYAEDRTVGFVRRVLDGSGIGDESSLPPGIHYIPIPPNNNFNMALAEAELVVFTAIDDLFSKTGVTPDAVDIVVINCSVFTPVPSLSDMIVSRYKLRSDVRSVNLSGMGCSAGVVSVELAAGLLRAMPQEQVAHAMVVSTEIITPNLYVGKERPMQLSNVLFRVGGAAVLLSTSKDRARFRLAHLVRTITCGADDGDRSFRCIIQEEDAEGITGVNLSKDLMSVAGDALRYNITALGPLVLPFIEQLRFVANKVLLKLLGRRRAGVKPYVPDWIRPGLDAFIVTQSAFPIPSTC
jgi:3-ketoacyl-CoA synthase